MDFDSDNSSIDSDDLYQLYDNVFSYVSDSEDEKDSNSAQIISANTFDIVDIMPHTCISIIGKTSTRNKALIKKIMHILNAKYDVKPIIVSNDADTITFRDYGYPHHSIKRLTMSKFLITSKTVLIFDNSSYNDDQMNLFCNFLLELDINFHNIIICCTEECEKKKLCIPYDIHFIIPAYDSQKQKIYDQYIDKQVCSLDNFNSLFKYTKGKQGFSLVIQNGKPSVYQAETIDTYYKYFFECNLFRERNISLLNRIKNGYSMFHKYDSSIVKWLQFTIDYNKKCCHILMYHDLITPRLPNELYRIICEFMILIYLDIDFLYLNSQ